MLKIHINKDSFLTITSGCLEVYKKEAGGVLFGKKKGDLVSVMQAHIYQSTKRGFSDLEFPSLEIERRVNDAVEVMSGYALVGDIHSHCNYGKYLANVGLSGGDLEGLLKDNKSKEIFCSIVLGLNPAERVRGIRIKEGIVSGSLSINENKYHLEMKAYYHNGRLRRARIDLPKKFKELLESGGYVWA
jgi:hypothetical protein